MSFFFFTICYPLKLSFRTLSMIAFALALFGVANITYAGQWISISTAQNHQIGGGAYGNGFYVLTTRGSSGVLVSNDSINWDFHNLGYDLLDISFGNGRFVAVGLNGTVITSSNGTTWATQTAFTKVDIQGVTYAEDQFVAVAWDGGIFSSADGLTWNIEVSPVTNDLYDVAYGAGLWVAVGSETTIITSLNAIVWTDESDGHIANVGFHGVGYGNGLWAVVGSPNSNVLSGSGDGTWYPQTTGFSASHDAVAYAFGRIWITSYDGSILSSKDGVSWSSEGSPVSVRLTGIEYLNGKLIAMGISGEILVYIPDDNLNVGTAIELWIPETDPGEEYQLQISEDLESWTDILDPIAGDGKEWAGFFTTRDQNKKFFRVKPDAE
ncbi:hypothetical protein G0Q06_11820 [Puniceicoccales bacterium CK1056]|uniref:Photosynthesis system II assembly factor Ycf48/Hcf136-like domain-containing protein n=1 Tax=Oceanipulchritudo coccoides TaxID=2706888 RepID=A0A6B2M4B8_9BACT|nr:hypothetical protein [Oceanipulchritudo coccoides]NDV63142.1 hypothetical protein [Oceanipulchritudo coccoides]